MLRAMFVLELLDPANPGAVKKTWFIYKPESYTIGRKDTDILILDDKSISRKHAVLTLELGVEGGSNQLFLTDSSQYGSHLQGEQVTSGEKVPIEPGSAILLGATGTTIKIKYRPLVFCLSGFSDSEKLNLSKKLAALGLFVTNDLDKATHLMQKQPVLVLTMKALCAIILGKPIVTEKFTLELEKRKLYADPLPAEDRFQPQLPSNFTSEIIAFDPKRKQIFNDLLFIFLHPIQCDRVAELIIKAGGRYLCPIQVATNAGSDQIKLESFEDEPILFSAERLRAVWVNPESEKIALTDSSKKLLQKIWSTATKNHKVQVVEIKSLGEAVLYKDRKRLGPSFVSQPSSDHAEEDLDKTADDDVAIPPARPRSSPAKVCAPAASAPAPAPSPVSLASVHGNPKPKPIVTNRRAIVDDSQAEEELPFARSTLLSKRKRSPSPPPSRFNSSKPFKKQKFAHVEDPKEIVPVTLSAHVPNSAHAQQLEAEFSRQVTHDRMGDEVLLQRTKFDMAPRKRH